jgi:hypothetical protein
VITVRLCIPLFGVDDKRVKIRRLTSKKNQLAWLQNRRLLGMLKLASRRFDTHNRHGEFLPDS